MVGRTMSCVLLAVVVGCASPPPPPPWAVSEYHVAAADFDKAWDAAIAVAAKYFDGAPNANKAERRIVSRYYYPNERLDRQMVEIRIDPEEEGFVVRVRTILEELTRDVPPRWVITGYDEKANDQLLEEIRKRTYGRPIDNPPPKT
ncbi:MAG: hypothetical protein HYR85_21350 [Planctomycetes bacterium]|nr:hypothetical protein [Planctomycetota bacterium]MBI3843853.1 hypothetical protein [Planctomycetota bacterium]